MAGRLEGQRIVVNGGAGGAGAASSRLFATEGARIAILDIQEQAGKALADELSQDGHQVCFHHADCSDSTQVKAAIDASREQLGGIDALFNHAGTFIVKRLIDTSEEDWDRLMAINVKSMFLTSRAVLPGMMEQRAGVILNTSSVSGLTANPLESAYCTTKGAILQLTRAIAVEYREYGIRCNAICPGFIRTPHGLNEIQALADHGEEVTTEDIATSQGRFAEPEDIARAALALLSDDTRFVNGAFLLVDNGWVALT